MFSIRVSRRELSSGALPRFCFILATIIFYLIFGGVPVVFSEECVGEHANTSVPIRLNYDNFCASGQGNIVDIARYEGESHLEVGQYATDIVVSSGGQTWKENHGIRFRQALQKSFAMDIEWKPARYLDGTTNPFVRITEESGCVITEESSIEKGDICESEIKHPISFAEFGWNDEAIISLSISRDIEAGEFKIQLLDENGQSLETVQEFYEGTTGLYLPKSSAGYYSRVALRIQGIKFPTDKLIHKISISCADHCKPISIGVDNLSLTRDVVSVVKKVVNNNRNGIRLVIEPGITRYLERLNSNEDMGDYAIRPVFDIVHDDTLAVRNWLRFAREYRELLSVQKSINLFAPNGIFNLSEGYLAGFERLNIFNDTHITCEDNQRTIFFNGGLRQEGGRNAFFTASYETNRNQGVAFEFRFPENIKIENCKFEINGNNYQRFLSVIGIGGNPNLVLREDLRDEEDPYQTWAKNIEIRNNVIEDNYLPTRRNCGRGLSYCEVLQRQYIVITGVNSLIIENNILKGGGRIKAGAPGKNMKILGNYINFVNDNAITFVDIRKNGASLDTDLGIERNNESPCSVLDPIDKYMAHIACENQNIEIVNNRIVDPVGVGIFFGGDGTKLYNKVDNSPSSGNAFTPRMKFQNILVANNEIVGHFTSGIRAQLPPLSEDIVIRDNRISPLREHKIERSEQNMVLTRGIGVFARSGRSVVANSEGVRDWTKLIDSQVQSVKIYRNTIQTSLPYGKLNNGGIVIGGDRFRRIEIENNEITCQECAIQSSGSGGGYIDRGIRLTNSDSEVVDGTITVKNNLVVGTTIAMEHSGRTILNYRNSLNSFCYSTFDSELPFTRNHSGLVSFQPIRSGARSNKIRGVFSNNIIQSNTQLGVYCSEQSDLKDLQFTENLIKTNRGDIRIVQERYCPSHFQRNDEEILVRECKAADLRVRLDGPTEAVSGQDLGETLLVKVHNSGLQPAMGQVSNGESQGYNVNLYAFHIDKYGGKEVFLRRNGELVIPSDAHHIGASTFTPTVNPRSTEKITRIRKQLSSSKNPDEPFTPGLYCLAGKVDVSGSYTEQSLSNNTSCHWITILPN